MKARKYEIAVVRTRRNLMPLEDAARRLGLHPDIVQRFLEFGLLEPAEGTGAEIMLDPVALRRIGVIQRLRYDLGINLAGIGVILDLLDRIDALQRGGRHGYQ
jgi:DNA-binding transcriptional MerR regulator